jgi:hypothetical protein
MIDNWRDFILTSTKQKKKSMFPFWKLRTEDNI